MVQHTSLGISTRVWISAPVGYYIVPRTAYRRPTTYIIYHHRRTIIYILYDNHLHRMGLPYMKVPKRRYVGAGCYNMRYDHRDDHHRITYLHHHHRRNNLYTICHASRFARHICYNWPMTCPTPHNTVCLTVNIRKNYWEITSIAGAIWESYVSYIFS